MKFIFSVLLLIIYGNFFCQITIKNTSNIPISSVELYSSKKTLLTLSDENGRIEWSKIKNCVSTDTIYFKHFEYDTKLVLRQNIKMTDTIVLTHKVKQLNEVLITANKTKKYQTIDACYRSYQLNDDSLIYYTDGKVDYLTKTKQIKYKRKLKEHRSYTDSSYTKNIKVRPYMIIFLLARIAPPLIDYLPKKYFKRHKLDLSYQADGKINILTKNKIKIGSIEKDSNFITYFINDTFSVELRKAPKFIADQISSEITLVFKNNNKKTNLIKNSYDDLVYSKIYRKYNIKHSNDKNYTKIEGVEEIFVENIQYLNEVEIDKFTNSFGFPEDSNYQTAFWEKCDCNLYSLPPYAF